MGYPFSIDYYMLRIYIGHSYTFYVLEFFVMKLHYVINCTLSLTHDFVHFNFNKR